MRHMGLLSKVGKPANLLIVAGVALLAILGFQMAVFLPVYADEMGYRLISSRYLIDGGVNIYLFPQCGRAYSTPVPIWMLPFRLAESFVYAPSVGLLHIRAIGAGLNAISIFGTIAFLIYRAPLGSASVMIAAVLAFFGLGVLPFATVMNRPDLWIRSAVVLWCLAPLLKSPRNDRWVKQSFFLGLIIILPAAAVASMHLKAILFFPLAALATWHLAHNVFLRAFGLLVLAFVAISTYTYWTARLACPEYPAFNQLFGQAVSPSLLWSDPAQFITSFAGNVLNFPRYVSNIIFQDHYISDWLPGSTGGLISETANAAIYLLFSLMFLTWIWASCCIAWRIIRYKEITQSALIVIILSCCVIFVAGISITKYFIESPLMLPLSGLAVWLAIQQLPQRFSRKVAGLLFAILTLAFSICQIPLFNAYSPYVKGAWRQGGYAPGQYISFNYSNYAQTEQRIVATARLCDIDVTKKLVHPITDSLTYPVFVESFQPFEVLWTGLNWPGSPQSQLSFLRSIRSSGAVSACHLLPPSFSPYVRRNGDLCCVPAFDTLPTASQ
ncbi:hypothetical protein [Rhizobium sp. L245/93]|uniref:hypothetical protein n=1 Tax=Rhizobium sp. L245/93 TaxID=2819998 RepID=UPI001ADA30F7|nr:hypothetical protein [Rhizobium sp. L245/93]MBO9170423.1 hypothetical protein [Rhizobium sp. L245/93]